MSKPYKMKAISKTKGISESLEQRNQAEIENLTAVMMSEYGVSDKALVDELQRRGYRGYLCKFPEGVNIETVPGGIEVESVSFDLGASNDNPN